MSHTATATATLTTNADLEQSSSVRQILRAYEIHQTGSDTSQRSGWDTLHPFAPSRRSDWDLSRRRTPPYRDPDTTHRLSDRPSGRSWGEGAFVVMMFSGAWTVSMANKIWRNTVGIYRDDIWEYDVGGEW